MRENRRLLLDGYEFELTGFFCEDGMTTITMNVSGNGESPSDLKGWVLEVCPDEPQRFLDDINIVSCEKRRRHGAWVPAIAQKTTYELTGDIGVAGVIISDWIGRYEDDPDVEYRVVFDNELEFEPVCVGIVFASETRISEKKMNLKTEPQSKEWVTPVEKSFCLYIVVPEGYKPLNVCKANISITKRLTFIAHVRNEDQSESEKPMRAVLMGAVRVMASVPLKSSQACGDEVHITAHDCFEVCETIGYADEDAEFEMRDVSVCPVPKCFDLTMLNAHCGRAVYRLDGKYVIGCKRCEEKA